MNKEFIRFGVNLNDCACPKPTEQKIVGEGEVTDDKDGKPTGIIVVPAVQVTVEDDE